MTYIQVVEIHTRDPEELERVHETWLAATEGQRTIESVRVCRDRDRPDTYLLIVEFPSDEAAAINNDLPATAEIAAALSALATEPLTFLNLDQIRRD